MAQKTKTCIGSPTFPDCRAPYISQGGPRKRCSTCQDAIAEERDHSRRRHARKDTECST